MIIMATITFRVDDELKQQASELYQEMGLDLSSALKWFLKQSLVNRGIPFEIRANSIDSIVEDAMNSVNMSKKFTDVSELMRDLDT